MKSTAKQENKFNFKRNIYIPKMCVDLGPGGLQQLLLITLALYCISNSERKALIVNITVHSYLTGDWHWLLALSKQGSPSRSTARERDRAHFLTGRLPVEVASALARAAAIHAQKRITRYPYMVTRQWKAVHVKQWSSTGRNRPPGGILCVVACGGDFVIYEIWGAISVSRGPISAGWNILNFWLDSKKTKFVSLESRQLMHFRFHGS